MNYFEFILLTYIVTEKSVPFESLYGLKDKPPFYPHFDDDLFHDLVLKLLQDELIENDKNIPAPMPFIPTQRGIDLQKFEAEFLAEKSKEKEVEKEKSGLEFKKLKTEVDLLANQLSDYGTTRKQASNAILIAWISALIAVLSAIATGIDMLSY